MTGRVTGGSQNGYKEYFGGGRSEAVGVWVQVPMGLAKKRAATARDGGLRGTIVRIIPPHIFDQYAAAFETPIASEQVIPMAGNVCFELQYRRLRRQLPGAGLRPLVS